MIMDSIIYVQWTNNVGGLERITQDFEAVFSNFKPEVIPLRYKPSGIHYQNTRLLKTRNIKFLSYLEYLLLVFSNRKAIYHLQYAGTINLLLTYLAGARKIIFHFHGTRFSANAFERLIWKFLQKKIKIIANSEHTKKVVMDKLDVCENIYKIPNIIDTTRFSFKEKKIKDPFIISYAGRLSKGKNPDLIIETARHLRNCRVEINIYGGGELAEALRTRVDTYHLSNIINFHPYSNDITEVYHQSNLFIFLSAYESFGNVVAEALLTGLPVICSDLPSLREFINDDDFFVKDLDPKHIAAKIMDMKNNYETLTRKTKVVSEILRVYLNKEKIVNTLSDLYTEVSLNKLR